MGLVDRIESASAKLNSVTLICMFGHERRRRPHVVPVPDFLLYDRSRCPSMVYSQIVAVDDLAEARKLVGHLLQYLYAVR